MTNPASATGWGDEEDAMRRNMKKVLDDEPSPAAGMIPTLTWQPIPGAPLRIKKEAP